MKLRLLARYEKETMDLIKNTVKNKLFKVLNKDKPEPKETKQLKKVTFAEDVIDWKEVFDKSVSLMKENSKKMKRIKKTGQRKK